VDCWTYTYVLFVLTCYSHFVRDTYTLSIKSLLVQATCRTPICFRRKTSVAAAKRSLRNSRREDNSQTLERTSYLMPTDLPYAADAEISLSYDELDVCIPSVPRASIHPVSSRFCGRNTRKSGPKITSPPRPNSTMLGAL
jgi:hypothetical protein